MPTLPTAPDRVVVVIVPAKEMIHGNEKSEYVEQEADFDIPRSYNRCRTILVFIVIIASQRQHLSCNEERYSGLIDGFIKPFNCKIIHICSELLVHFPDVIELCWSNIKKFAC
mmetsp:Transcript_23219/g.35313  ORF Transcript_23219/g.35313 Transcript_23219/m.35313 type:complete len:113 (+) Transcript_23219:433-771(+)